MDPAISRHRTPRGVALGASFIVHRAGTVCTGVHTHTMRRRMRRGGVTRTTDSVRDDARAATVRDGGVRARVAFAGVRRVVARRRMGDDDDDDDARDVRDIDDARRGRCANVEGEHDGAGAAGAPGCARGDAPGVVARECRRVGARARDAGWGAEE